MFSIIFGACQQNFFKQTISKDNPDVKPDENRRLKIINVTVTCLDLALLISCIAVGALNAQIGFSIPPTVQWSMIEVGVGGIAMLAYKKVLPASKEDNITSA